MPEIPFHAPTTQFLAIIACSCLALASSTRADSPPVAAKLLELQRSLAGTTNVQSDFVQEKRLAMLQRNVVIKGHLTVQQPDRFSWQVTEPVRYTLILEGTTLRQWDETTDRVQQMSLAGNPVFGVVATQLRAWFAGKLDSLSQDFEAAVEAVESGTRLVFTPRTGSFAHKAIRRVALTFREDGRYLQSMDVEELSGDRTWMTFTNTVLNGTPDARAWEVKPHGR
jgi:outer membrane lipoprotein-sorting protein